MCCQPVAHPPAHVLVSVCTLHPETSIPKLDGFPYLLQFAALHVLLSKLPGIVTPEAVIGRVLIVLPARCTLAIRLPAFHVLDLKRSR